MPGQGDDVLNNPFDDLLNDFPLMEAQDTTLEPSGTQATTVTPAPEPSPALMTHKKGNPKPTLEAIQAKNLITLRRATLSLIQMHTGIRTPNLSVWLRGKTEQVLSPKRVALLLSYLGVENGRLRSDVLHQWFDDGSLLNTERAFQTWLGQSKERVLVKDDIATFPQVRFVLADAVLIRLEVSAGLKEARSLADVFKPTKTVHVSSPLSEVPVKSIDEARIRLDELMGMVDTSVPVPSAGAVAMNDLALSEKDAELLHAALRRAVQAGATVEQIASLLDRHWGQNI